MSTKIYGASDDLIEFEGDLRGEASGGSQQGALVALSDGTILLVNYGKPVLGGVWAITVLRKGDLFERLDVCEDEDADLYSDVAHFRDGKLRAWVASDMEIVR